MSNNYAYVEGLVSVVMPAYNCEEFIEESINSVVKQTYTNWELIIINDCSTDNTEKIINRLAKNISNIIVYSFSSNQGAALARNKGVEIARGEFIAFIDSDDLWFKEKLTEQILFMKNHDYSFTCTNYNKIDKNGFSTDKIVSTIQTTDYRRLLKYCPGNSTVIYNAKVLGKFYITSIRKRNDYLMWLMVIKKAKYLNCLNNTLSSHRIRNGSLSNKKTSLLKYHWYIYRNIEKLSYLYSVYLIMFWIGKKVFHK
jgi:glycosyltransferase involved in cell wall biosynthesis